MNSKYLVYVGYLAFFTFVLMLANKVVRYEPTMKEISQLVCLRNDSGASGLYKRDEALSSDVSWMRANPI